MKIERIDFHYPTSLDHATLKSIRIGPHTEFYEEGDFLWITHNGKSTRHHVSCYTAHYADAYVPKKAAVK